MCDWTGFLTVLFDATQSQKMRGYFLGCGRIHALRHPWILSLSRYFCDLGSHRVFFLVF